jgi:hypothetical protein
LSVDAAVLAARVTLLNPVEVLWREGVATSDVVRSLRRLEEPPPFVMGRASFGAASEPPWLLRRL